jgi:hypothetical protein
LVRPTNHADRDAPFWGQRFSMGRVSLQQINRATANSNEIHIEKGLVIYPGVGGGGTGVWGQECRAVSAHLSRYVALNRDAAFVADGTGEVRDPERSACRRVVRAALNPTAADEFAVHFMGHGGYDPAANGRGTWLQLAPDPLDPNGDRTIVATDVLRIPERRISLAFLNACLTETASNRWDTSGWADRLYQETGAAAVVGTFWPVLQRSARDVAVQFYSSLHEDRLGCGETLRRIRLRFDEAAADLTFLAYGLFGHPDIKVSFAARSAAQDAGRICGMNPA